MNYKLGRIKKRFELLKSSKEKGLITFVTEGDPDYNTSLSIIKRLPDAGADLIEIGMPFTDPMADGVGIQASYLRSLNFYKTMISDKIRCTRMEATQLKYVHLGIRF